MPTVHFNWQQWMSMSNVFSQSYLQLRKCLLPWKYSDWKLIWNCKCFVNTLFPGNNSLYLPGHHPWSLPLMMFDAGAEHNIGFVPRIKEFLALCHRLNYGVVPLFWYCASAGITALHASVEMTNVGQRCFLYHWLGHISSENKNRLLMPFSFESFIQSIWKMDGLLLPPIQGVASHLVSAGDRPVCFPV